ncbi:tannase and feruloyl esterase [Aspergillus ellipticus CBS 707.79]|uniref:Carboxylic ester hydrolase n=1 Tax=Aspergillus ellipticus CBS 707.79 TaxID=1448320 RepID=A0A319CYD5_9EURO|nr:tannase and feruloyl esterase [Aspergillus ellipticus CBS 707.79]
MQIAREMPKQAQGTIALETATASPNRCSPAHLPKPNLPGATILNVQAQEAHNYSAVSLGPGTNDGGRYTINFCNVTVTHTHPGWNDSINTQIWLPLESNWNGRFQALGGGGYSTGFGSIYLTYAVAQGFASASTDGGVSASGGTIPTDLSWSLSSEGNVNWFLLEDYASKATNDMAVIGKQITRGYYGRPARYSYFAGCSGGGRQGLMMAQDYPDVFDGILAVSPAINPETFIPAGYWGVQVMNQDRVFPSPCEIEGFMSKAVEACDRLDGVADGIVSLPGLCHVRAVDFVGQNYTCGGSHVQHTLTAGGAKVVDAAWSGSGSGSEEEGGWFGLNKDADITSYYLPTTCAANGTACTVGNSDLSGNWFQYLVAKDPNFEMSNLPESAFFSMLRESTRKYGSMLGSNNPDLSEFKANGGKIITWHGLADEVIPPNGTVGYYEEVLKLDGKARDFFRFFEAPGVGHCYGGLGPIPNGALSQLMEWVEKDQTPDTLHATKGSNDTARDLCPYPLRQMFVGGDPRNATSFACA